MHNMIRILGDSLNNNQELRHIVEATAVRGLLGVADSVCLQRINWDRIVVTFNVVWRRARTLVVRILVFHNSLFPSVFLWCTLHFLRSWIHERGRRDCIHVNRLATRILIVSERLRNDQQFQAGICAMAQIRGLRWEIFNLMAQNVCRECITFERITVLLYVGGKMAVKNDNFRTLVRTSVNAMTSSCSGLILTLITGIALGSFITWGTTRRL